MLLTGRGQVVQQLCRTTPKLLHQSAPAVCLGPGKQRVVGNRRHHTLTLATAETVTVTAEKKALVTAFYGLADEQQVFDVMSKEAEAGRVPKQLVPAFHQLYESYKKAVVNSGAEGADDKLVAKIMASIVDRVLVELIQPYQFPSSHKRILEPYNYYEFGQQYVGALMDFSTSVVGNIDIFKTIEKQLAEGHNVVLLANHQTEADPGVFALSLEAACPTVATEVIYVAGDRVVSDALCKPFSMGRNLFCVHSKKHMELNPTTKAEKMAMNRRTLVAMGKELEEGGKLLWIAPSGGRDRKDPETGELLPAPFDPAAVELMRQLTTRASPPGHLYPFAMYSYELMPPPPTVEKSLGEQRITNFTATGISAGPELDVEKVLDGIDTSDKEALHKKLADTAWAAVVDEYKGIMAALESKDNWGSKFSQPWKQ